MADSRIKDVSSLLSAFFDEEKLRMGGRYADFFGSWKQLAGPHLAAHSRVAEVEKGFLIVEAEHPGWIQLLQLRQAEILEATKRRFPELGLRGIVFRLGSTSDSQAGSSGAGLPGPFGPGAREPGAEDASSREEEPQEELTEAGQRDPLERITDDGLRQTLQRLKKAVDLEQKKARQ